MSVSVSIVGLAGKLVTVSGTVVRASNVAPLVVELDFVCEKCGESTRAKLLDGAYCPPAACDTDGCRGRTFQPDRKSARGVDWQKLRIQVRSRFMDGEMARINYTAQSKMKFLQR